MSKVSSMLAEELGVSVDELVRAANQSVWGQCKSTPLILVWLAKPFFVLRTMREFPNVNEFAYADAGQWPVSGTAPPSLGVGCHPSSCPAWAATCGLGLRTPASTRVAAFTWLDASGHSQCSLDAAWVRPSGRVIDSVVVDLGVTCAHACTCEHVHKCNCSHCTRTHPCVGRGGSHGRGSCVATRVLTLAAPLPGFNVYRLHAPVGLSRFGSAVYPAPWVRLLRTVAIAIQSACALSNVDVGSVPCPSCCDHVAPLTVVRAR